jgi:hypothetical protein
MNLLSAKNASPIALVFQQVGLLSPSALEDAKTEDDSVPYLTSTAVVSAAECLAHPEPVFELLLVKGEGLSYES